MGTSIQNGPQGSLFVWEKVLFIPKSGFLINILFGNIFQIFRVNRLNDATVCETLMLKCIYTLGESVFSMTVRGKPSFQKLVISLFKLIQFVCLVMEW